MSTTEFTNVVHKYPNPYNAVTSRLSSRLTLDPNKICSCVRTDGPYKMCKCAGTEKLYENSQRNRHVGSMQFQVDSYYISQTKAEIVKK